MIDDLQSFPLFASYSREELEEQVLPHLEPRSEPEGAIICRERAAGDSCFFLVRGSVDVQTHLASGKIETIGRLEAGSIFGQIVLLDGGTRSATCVAATACELLELHGDQYTLLREKQARLAFDLAREIAKNLARQVRQAVESLSAMSESRVEDPLALSKRLRSFVRGRTESGSFVKLRDIKL